MAWISPTGYADPDSKWSNEVWAYDNNLGQAAYSTFPFISGQSWGTFIELTHSAMLCSKVRFYASQFSGIATLIDIDAYYGGWNHLYQGSFNHLTWVEKTLSSAQTITKFRIRFYNNNITATAAALAEVDFYGVMSVTTQAVGDILHSTATGNGNITDKGGENATKRGVCWKISSGPTVADSKAEEEGSFGTGSFTADMTGLDPNITYYVKAYAYNSDGYKYGSQVSFTTDKTTPTVTVQAPTTVLPTTVTANGNITALGGENATVRGFKYGLTKTDTWSVSDSGSYSTGAFTKAITGLDANTTYWIRAYATNGEGTSYSAWLRFQTAATGGIPTGTNISICSDNSGYTFKLNSAFTDDGETYESYFVLSTDLAQKQGLHFKKRLLDLSSYFEGKDSGTCKIYIKQDNEAEWQYAGEISMVGDEDIIVKHLPSENVDSVGDVDFLAKHFLVKFVFENDFEFVGLITESILIGVR